MCDLKRFCVACEKLDRIDAEWEKFYEECKESLSDEKSARANDDFGYIEYLIDCRNDFRYEKFEAETLVLRDIAENIKDDINLDILLRPYALPEKYWYRMDLEDEEDGESIFFSMCFPDGLPRAAVSEKTLKNAIFGILHPDVRKQCVAYAVAEAARAASLEEETADELPIL